MKKSNYLKLVAGLLLMTFEAVFLSGCWQSPEKPKAEQTPAPSPAGTSIPTSAPKNEAVVIFVSGRVETLKNTAWAPVNIGDSLAQDSRLKVKEKSVCEIQFGNTGVVRINENTEVFLETIAISESSNKVGVKLESGSVLAKVSKLGGQDRFQVKTGVAVCGVRGTEFGVTAGRDGKTVLKVKSGQVAVLPATADVERIGKKIETDEKSREIIQQTVAKVIEAAPVVETNQEIVITQETVRKTENLVALVEKEIPQIAVAAPDKTEEKDKKIGELSTQIVRQAAAALEKPAAMSEANKKALEVIDTMTILPMQAPPPSTAAPGQPSLPQAAPPVLRTLSITTVPEDAEIFQDGKAVGRGNLKRLLQDGTKLEIRVQREGYEPKVLPVEIGPSPTLDLKVELAPKPREVSIQADPGDAEILVGGAVVGRGTYRGSFAPGTTVTIGVRKAGFEEKTLDVKITMDMAPVLKISLGKVSKEVRISVEPRDSRIFLGPSLVGTGSYQGIYNVGDRLNLRFEREGYQGQTQILEVREQGDNSLSLTLDRLKKTLTLNAEPSDARIILNGRSVGSGSYTETFEYGTSLVFEVEREGYVPSTVRLDVGDDTQTSRTVRLERERKDVIVSVIPSSAVILLEGRPVARGTYQAKHAVGEALNFTFQEDGYVDRTLKVEVTASAARPTRVELEAKAVYARIKTTAGKIIGLTAYGTDRLIVSDEVGKVFCVSSNGRTLWTVSTANTPNETSIPVLIGDKVYFSGAKEFVIIDAEKGTVLVRQTLDSASANLFGRRVVAHPSGVLFPANQNILVLDPATGETRRTIKIGGDCMMTPLYTRDRIYIADQLGKIHILNAETGAEEAVIATQALQPVAQAIQVSGTAGYFSGRRGNVVAFDLEKNTVLWQAKLTEDSSATVFHDLAIAVAGVSIYSKNQLFFLNASTGASLHEPIKDVGTPPLAHKDTIVYGTQSNGVVFRGVTGAPSVKTLSLNARPTSRPEPFRNDYVALGTQDGEIIIVNPRGIK